MLDGAELRALIRDVIETELAAARKAQATDSTPSEGRKEHKVRISNDADLNAFAKQVLSLAADSAVHKAIVAGSYTFKLEGAPAVSVPASSSRAGGGPASASARIDQGVVTETALAKLPRGTTRLQIGAAVSVTPLARDKARALGIVIERMKP
jgi:hypothetical protein